MKKKIKRLPSQPSSSTLGMAQKVRTLRSASWQRMQEQNTVKLFHETAKRVPAYQAFLKAHKVHAKDIRTYNDFITRVPATNKATYLRKYPLADLCWDGSLARPAVFSSTSGSTGKPFYFQRTPNLEEEYSILAELFLSNGTNLPGPDCPTLVIIGFGMGVWIGGTLTFRAFDIASRRSHPISILPAGVNKAEIMKALHDLSPSFKQTIIIGYPPFVKDIIDEAELEKIPLKKFNVRFLFAAEAFSEHFRDYLAKKAGIKNVYRDTLNIYGTADIGAMAYETPTSILIRRLAMKNKKLFSRIFGEAHKTPTLAQYNPAFVSFEAPKGEVLLTGSSAVPLIRYAVGDHGGVHTYDEIEKILAESGINLKKEAKKLNVPLYELPFVYVYARVDLSTKLYGAIIYPEHVRDALEEKEMQKLVTGKFTMMTVFDRNQNQSLEINVELRKGIEASGPLLEKVQGRVLAHLLEKNSEYKNNHSAMADRVLPKIVFWQNGDPTYFTPGIKQKWVISSDTTQKKG